MACQIANDNLHKIACKFMFSITDSEQLVHTCETTLSSKIVNRYKRQIATLCVKAVLAVADIERHDVNIELIIINGKVGGKLEDTTLVDGVVIDKDMSHPLMKKKIENAKIALLTCPFEPPKPKTKHKVEIKSKSQFEILRKMECDFFLIWLIIVNIPGLMLLFVSGALMMNQTIYLCIMDYRLFVG